MVRTITQSRVNSENINGTSPRESFLEELALQSLWENKK